MNNNWRGRGGRGGRGRGQNSRDYVDSNNNNGSGISIIARLGPTNLPLNERAVHQSNNSNRNQSSHPSSHQQRGGRAFDSQNYRGKNNQNYNNARFNDEFIEEDIEMNSGNLARNIVTVTGYPPGSEEKVLGFISRKSKAAWEPLNVQYEQKAMHITVADETVVEALCKINNYRFGNAFLHIMRKSQNSTHNNQSNKISSNRKGTSPVLVNFLEERWNAQIGFLTMDNLPPTSHKLTVVIARLLDEAKNLFGNNVKTISFANNKLWSVIPILKVIELFPDLQNLSLANNDIAEFRNLDKIANKLPNLQELMLSGNPIQTNNPLNVYQEEVIKRFPSIKFLDAQPINSKTNNNMGAISSSLPLPVRSHFFDQDNSRLAVQDLLSKYFPLFDSNRASLLDLYDSQAIFSVVFSQGNPHQRSVWGDSQASPRQRMVFGNENIIKRLIQLPATVHDLSSADKFITDAWQTTGSQAHPIVLFLTVHGEFNELHAGNRLSFDRSFLVAPSSPGSRAHSAGWSYIILSDSLIVRNYSCTPASLINA
ncbi:uncharacterized protein BX663DRAFT_440240 [Cokeromyces recurvatus]|uniref:uncharacterized protein n=1 Tax=Cokeromyces recurvatus TaxID=90255 RepID=UPI002220F574|nr:uncharacterized protein BX663DRAFT_440240 [Cokeromyces recurvatus]KAI7899933.1 hypothetical protein BX663DRAFT_440240 [Cokeromyces recurvatus]